MMTEFALDQLDEGNLKMKNKSVRSRMSLLQIEQGIKIDLKYNIENDWRRFKRYPYHEWDDLNFQNFMIAILESLEVR